MIAMTLPASVFAYISPGKPVGLVNDFAKVFSVDSSNAIGSKLLDINKSTGATVVVVTVPSLGDETVDSYAVKLFQEWGIGNNKSSTSNSDKDRGLLVLIAPTEHKVRIEVGYGLEGTVTDLQAGNIVNKLMIPSFKNNDYSGGVLNAVDAIKGLILSDPTIVNAYSISSNQSSNNNSGRIKMNSDFYFFLIFFGMVILNGLARLFGRSKSWWLGGAIGATAGIVIGLFFGFIFIGLTSIIGLMILGLVADYYFSKHPPKSGGGGILPMFFGGGGFGGSGGGGFGGFGGGRSGGGGASGGW